MNEPIKPTKGENVVVDFARLNTKIVDENTFGSLVTISGLGRIRYKAHKLRTPTYLRKTTTTSKKDDFGFWTKYAYLEAGNLAQRRSGLPSKKDYTYGPARSGCMGDSGGKECSSLKT